MENQNNAVPSGGLLPVPSPDESLIVSQNARRLARRRQAAALALQVQQTSGEDLDRFGERRQVGGTFEDLQEVPERQAQQYNGLDMSDIFTFLNGLSFDPQRQQLGSVGFQSSFGPNILGLATTGLDTATPADQGESP